MGVNCTFYRKRIRKDDLENSINNTKIMIEHLIKELVALAALTPKNEEHSENWQPHEYIVKEVSSIIESLDEHMRELTMLELIQDNEQYCQEDNEWDDE